MEQKLNDGSPVQIRPSRESDILSFNDAVKAVAAEKWYLATVDGFSLEQTRAFLQHIVQGQGIGRRMLDACLSLARSTGIEKVELEVFSDNLAAVRLYETFGFSHEGLKVRGRKLEDRYQDVKLMTLWLDVQPD
jgi:GNAT superfamily N-acetyltransferase